MYSIDYNKEKRNKEADNAAKQVIDMQRMITTKLPYTAKNSY